MWLGSPVWFLRKLGRRGIKLLWRKQGPTGGGVQQPPSAEHGRGWVQEPSSLASKILLATLLFTWTRPSSRRAVGVVSPWVDGMVRSIMCLPRREAGCDHGLCATVLSRLEPLRVVGRESGSARRVVYSQCFMRKGISRVGATRSVDEHRGARNGAERRVALRQQLRALAARHLDDHLAEALLVEEEEVLHGVRGGSKLSGVTPYLDAQSARQYSSSEESRLHSAHTATKIPATRAGRAITSTKRQEPLVVAHRNPHAP